MFMGKHFFYGGKNLHGFQKNIFFFPKELNYRCLQIPQENPELSLWGWRCVNAEAGRGSTQIPLYLLLPCLAAWEKSLLQPLHKSRFSCKGSCGSSVSPQAKCIRATFLKPTLQLFVDGYDFFCVSVGLLENQPHNPTHPFSEGQSHLGSRRDCLASSGLEWGIWR